MCVCVCALLDIHNSSDCWHMEVHLEKTHAVLAVGSDLLGSSYEYCEQTKWCAGQTDLKSFIGIIKMFHT